MLTPSRNAATKARHRLISPAGVSPELLRSRVAAELAETYDNWDISADRPAGGYTAGQYRVKNVGRVLKAFYAVQRLREELKTAEQSERAYEEQCRAVSQLRSGTEALSEYLAQRERIVRDARIRAVAEQQFQNAKHP